MLNIGKIFQENILPEKVKSSTVSINKGWFIIKISSGELNSDSLKTLISSFDYIESKYPNLNLPINIVFGNIKSKDKLTYILLECILFHKIKNCSKKIILNFEIKDFILSAGISSSVLQILSNKRLNLSDRNEKFIKVFEYKIYKNHFRKLLKYEDYQGTDKLSKLYDDITYFQRNLNIPPEYFDEISEVIVELLGNAIEHSKSDCLVDLDISRDYVNSKQEPVLGINLVIINFSDTLLGNDIQTKIKTIDFKNKKISEKYIKVNEALENHKEFFDENYDEEDFFNITTFQDRISGRKEYLQTGGTGLTKLIKSLEDKSCDHACYVFSGSRILVFEKQYLTYKDNWIGFNKENDFISTKPSSDIFQRSDFFMPGTAYNLNFIVKVDNNGKE